MTDEQLKCLMAAILIAGETQPRYPKQQDLINAIMTKVESIITGIRFRNAAKEENSSNDNASPLNQIKTTENSL